MEKIPQIDLQLVEWQSMDEIVRVAYEESRKRHGENLEAVLDGMLRKLYESLPRGCEMILLCAAIIGASLEEVRESLKSKPNAIQ